MRDLNKIIIIGLFFLGCEHKKFLNPHDPINLPPAPEPLLPENNSISPNNPPFFQWDLKEDPLNPFYGDEIIYEIQISKNANFIGQIFLDSNIQYKTFIPDTLFGEGNYYWRLRSKYSETEWGEWSDTNVFDIRFPLISSLFISHCYDIAIKQGYVYLGHSSDLEIIDVTDPHHPQSIYSYSDTLSQFYSIVVEGDYLYAGFGDYLNSFLSIYDIQNPTNPILKGCDTFPIHYLYNDLAVENNYAYITDYSVTYIIDITNPESLYIVDSLSTGGRPIAIKDNYAFLLKGSYLDIVDIKTHIVNTILLPGSANSIAISRNNCFLAGDKVWIYDITDPLNADLIATINERGDAIIGIGNFLFFTELSGYHPSHWMLYIYDITAPANPERLGMVSNCCGLISADDSFVYTTWPRLTIIKYE